MTRTETGNYCIFWPNTNSSNCLPDVMFDLKRFNKIAIQGAPQMAVDKEAISLSRVYSYYSKCNLPFFLCVTCLN